MNAQRLSSVNHLGIIPDGARRWARQNNTSYLDSYIKSMKHLIDLLDAVFHLEVSIASIYLLSVENLKREQYDLQAVYESENLFVNELLLPFCAFWDCKINVAGKIDLLPDYFRESTNTLIDKTKSNNMRKVYLLLAYNPWDEITNAISQSPKINEIRKFMWVPESLDLVIRTGYGQLMSNFLPLQSAYAELVFYQCYFNDLQLEDVKDAIISFPQSGTRLLGK